MTYGGFDKKGVLVASRTVINGSSSQEPFLHKYYRDCLERFIVMEPGNKVGINDTEIRAIKAKHSDPLALGFKFITPDYTLSYTGDTSYAIENISGFENSNVLILNVPCINKGESKYNLSKEDAINLIKKVNPHLAIITHFGINFLKSDPLYEVREIQKATNVQTIAATDGMVVNPLSYSVEQGQKTLYKYSKNEGIRFQDFPKEEKFKDVDEILKERQVELATETNTDPHENT
jgi:hypothetical protein